METTINGQPLTFEPHPLDTAIDVIRDQAGLTGTKLACGGGVCGACTVLVDNVPTCSCLMPANHMEGKAIQTIEAHGRDNLHPVQRAFMANEGLQCGFCTPGFVNEGIAFYNSWREAHGKTRPSQHDIALAMGGHLCRCAAYVGIYEAIAQACAGDFDEVTELIAPRVDAIEKVTGEAKYTVDVQLDGLLEGRILRSPYPNAMVKSIDFSAAQGLAGVEAVADLMEGKRRIRFVGQPVAAVAAIDGRTAEAALKLIKVDYQVMAASVDFETADQPDAPEVWDDDKGSIPTAAEGTSLPYRWNKNVGRARMGLITSRWAGAAGRRLASAEKNEPDRYAAHTFRNSQQVHTALEPHAAVAQWDGADKLHVYTSTQGVYGLRFEIAEHFDLDKDQVTVESHYIGGAFGGKQGMYREIVAAITVARHAGGRPVRIVNNRMEELAYASLRPGMKVDAALAVKPDGTAEAMKLHSYGNAGVAGGTITAALASITAPRGAYRDMADFVVTTNTSQGTPFRGPDAPQQRWAMEQLIDEVALKQGVDPVTMRRKWDPKHEIKNRLLDWVESIPGWRDRAKAGSDKGRFRRGIGLSTAQWIFMYNPDTQLTISSSPEGIKVSCATQDIGNGTRTTIAKAVEDLMGISRNDLVIEIGDASLPLGPVAGGSQVTPSVYPTTYQATEALMAHLIKEAESKMGLSGCSVGQGGINHTAGFTAWADVLAIAAPFSLTEKRANERGPLGIPMNTSTAPVAPALGMRFSHGATVTELEVDTRLGKIRPLNVWNAVAVGKIFVPHLANSQMYSGVIQGLGYALYEEKVYDLKTGHVLSSNLNDYRVPGIGDTPNIHIHYDQEGYEEVQGQGIGLSELATVGVAASVGNAVHHATGWRPLNTPITPKTVVIGLGMGD